MKKLKWYLMTSLCLLALYFVGIGITIRIGNDRANAAGTRTFGGQNKYEFRSIMIDTPDGVNDDVEWFRVDDMAYPNGITIDHISIQLATTVAYTITVAEHLSTTDQNDIVAINTDTGGSEAYTVVESGFDDSTIDAGDSIWLEVPNTDVDWVTINIGFHAK